jgi:hypothetical protein
MKSDNLIDLQKLYFYPQYSIVIFVILYSLFTFKKVNVQDLILLLIMLMLGLISTLFGLQKGLDVNIRGIVDPIIFILVVNSKSYRLLKPIFVASMMFVACEYILYYSNIEIWSNITRYGLLRPYGLFFSTTITSTFIALTLFVYGWEILGAFGAVIMMTLQVPFTYIIILVKDLNFKKSLFIFSFALLIILLLFNIGHLDSKYKASLISTYIISFQEGVHGCYLIGCATNTIIMDVSEKSNLSRISDNGILRSLYYFGLVWIFIFYYLVLKNSKNKLLPTVYFLSILHYAVVFGVLGVTLLGIHINYLNRKYYYKVRC